MSQILNRRNRKNNKRFTSYEALEPRQLLATLTVTTTSDVVGSGTDGEISLREAIIAANTNAPFGDAPAGDVLDDRIEFADSLLGQTITLSGSELFITGQLTIFAGGEGVTIDANLESRVFSVDSDQDVILRNLTVTRGLDELGSGVHMSGGGTLRLFESTISNNGARVSNTLGMGAGVYLDEGTLVTNGSDFIDNHSFTGGAIYSKGNAVRIYSSLFTGNLGITGGGAIAVAAGDLFVSESEFASNRTPYLRGQGGAIDIVDRDSADDGSFAFVLNSTFDKNTSGDGGGISNGVNNSLVIHGSAFTSNSAIRDSSRYTPFNGSGGAIENLGDLRLVDAFLTDNIAGVGGAVYSRNNAVFNRVDLKRNTGGTSGGAVMVRGNARFYDTTFGGDHAEDGNKTNEKVIRSFGEGGALAVYGSDNDLDRVIVVRGEFKNNIAGVEGGAIYVAENANLQIVGGTQIIGNRALSHFSWEASQGGGISNYGSTLLASAEIKNNYSNEFAGGIYNGGGDLTMINSVISANRARIRGGGMEVAGGTAMLFSTTIGGDSLAEGNFAGVFEEDQGNSFYWEATAGRGAGVFMSGSVDSGTRFQMSKGKVSNNIARMSGGGFYNLPGNVIRFDNGVQVTNNRALIEGGGGAYNSGGHYEIRDAVFANNTARQGAGIFNYLGSVNLTNTNLSNNTARRIAGGFYNRSSYRFISSSIADNFAAEFPNFFDETD
ncbi:MAG: hypothetical protein AB8B55_23980 [Mariniblastus sp.]